MKIDVLLFATAKDIFGQSKIVVDLPADATVADLKKELLRLGPEASDRLERCAFSVEQQYSTMDTPIKAGQEVAVIPPVSGG